MAAHLKVISSKRKSKAQVLINGSTVEYLLEIGLIILCTDRVYSHGWMVRDMKELMKMIKSKVLENSIGQMVEYT